MSVLIVTQDSKKMLEKNQKNPQVTKSPRAQKGAEAQFLTWLSSSNPIWLNLYPLCEYGCQLVY